jgi:tetratricopeptide (TPR) repeat protein
MVQNVRLQRLRDFTVQIRDLDSDRLVGTSIVGTGIVVEPDRIITCAHVVEAALGRSPREAADEEIEIHFPRIEGREPLSLHAIVDRCFREHDDDIISLKLIDGTAPLGPDQLAKLGSADPSEGNPFRSYGYSPAGNYQATRADGTIMGTIEPPPDKVLLVDPVQLKSTDIDRGMSGSAVLDIERNLVVGLVAERYYPKNQIKPDLAYAVDNRVLTIVPFQFSLRDEPNPLQPAPEPKINKAEDRAAVANGLNPFLNYAPLSLEEWTGRKQLLQDITSDWICLETRITSLVGFGGEGKSSLARQWIDDLIANKSLPQPDGVFWWGFYERRSVDEFFDGALAYLSGGKIDSRKIPSSNLKAQIIGAMLGAGRFLFVLDGLEVLQHQEGDMYGSILSPDLKAFLEFFASPDHGSFCLVTSRVPLMDLEEYITYRHRDVERLLPQDGRDLLRKLGVRGDDDELDRVVADWGGHALTLSLLASYLKDHHGGDVSRIRNIPSTTADEPRYERVHRVLRRYDDHLDEAEKAFLMLFSAFRRPVDRDAFRIFRAKSEKEGRALNDPIVALSDSQFEAMVKGLVDYRILRHEPGSGQYTIHPLIRAHYSTLLTESQGQAEEAHKQIKDYYLAKAQGMPDKPTLEDLTPLIEVVHHACQCGAYNEVPRIHWERIHRGTFYITQKLGAWETELKIMQEFFSGGDTSQEPLVSSPRYKSWILNEVGICMANTGRGNLADRFYERGLAIYLESGDWANASVSYVNLSELYCFRGDLARSLQAAGQALDLARRARRKDYERNSLAFQAWAYHLQGDLDKASQHFRDAEALEKELDSLRSHLFSLRGIQHADHLRRRGEADYARKVTEANLAICEGEHWPDDMSRCQRVLADLFADGGQKEMARESYGQALELARSISHRRVLIEALLGRGRWYAKIMKDPVAAFSDLTEALEYARAGGYRLYEADIRIGLAWAHLVAGDKTAARDEAGYARRLSQEMGYYWGVKDAEEVLAEIGAG